MKKCLLILIIFLLFPLSAFAEDDDDTIDIKIDSERQEIDPTIEVQKTGTIDGKEATLTVSDLPTHNNRNGVHFERKYDVDFQRSGIKHEVPDSYVESVQKGNERRGFKEHLMIGFYSNVRSRYMSKELPDSIGPVWQPSATIEAYGFGLNVWSNFVLYDEPNQGQFNEVDFTPYYTAHIGNLTIHPYLLAMVFPNKNPGSLDYTPEFTLETDLYMDYTLWKFTLFTLMRAVAKGTTPGSIYAHVGTSFDHTFNSGITVSPSMLMSFGNDKFLTSSYQPMGANIDALSFSLALSWKVGKHMTFEPHINYAVHVIPKIRQSLRALPNRETYYVWGGLDLSYEF